MQNDTFNQSAAAPGGQCTGSLYNSHGKEVFFEINEFNLNDESQLPAYKAADQKLHTIIWFREGCGRLFIDLKEDNFYDHTIFYLEPGQLYRLGPQTSATGYHMCFSASFLDMSELFIGLAGALPSGQHRFFKTAISSANIINDLQNLVEEMIKESANQSLLGQEVLRGLIGIFLVHLARNNTASNVHRGITHDDQLAKKFLNLLNENVYARKMVCDYANELAISANYLNQVMKRYTGFTASHHIQQHTILEAKRRALYFGTTMKETAYFLGFDDLAHFSKFFKKNAGTSFREFSNEMKRGNVRTGDFKKHSAKTAYA